jgi:hypothetical protein
LIISHRHKFIYYPPSKTASSSICSFLASFGTETLGENRHDCFLPEEYESYFTFASVRNPYHRAVSGWSYFECVKNPNPVPKPIEEWILTPWFKPMVDMLFFRPSKKGCIPLRLDAIVRVETLERDMSNLPFVRQSVKMPYLNCSEYDPHLSDQLIEIVRDKYKLDFTIFGYDPDDRSRHLPF